MPVLSPVIQIETPIEMILPVTEQTGAGRMDILGTRFQ
jgi:hypothetical protein